MRRATSICGAGRVNAILILPLVVLTACADGDGPLEAGASAQAVAAPQASVQQLRSGTAAIMDIVDAATAAWSAKDASAYAALSSVDLVWINPLGAVLIGRATFEAQHMFLFNGPFAGSTQTIAVTDITPGSTGNLAGFQNANSGQVINFRITPHAGTGGSGAAGTPATTSVFEPGP
jgi:hypothetical protein